MTKTSPITRPQISFETEGSYISSTLEVGYYFISKYRVFFKKIREKNSDLFKLQISSKQYESPFNFPIKETDNAFIESVCQTIHVGSFTTDFDSQITLSILDKPWVGISLLHSRTWKERTTIYFFDHTEASQKMPGQEFIEYDPAKLNQNAKKFFEELIGFSSEKTTTLEEGLDVIEKVIQKLELEMLN